MKTEARNLLVEMTKGVSKELYRINQLSLGEWVKLKGELKADDAEHAARILYLRK